MTTEDCPGYDTTDRSAWYILISSVFLWWSFQLVLENFFDMGPIIRRTVSLREIEDHIVSVEEREQNKQEKTAHLEDLIMNIGPEDKKETEEEKEKSPPSKLKKVKTSSKNMLMKLTKSIDNQNQYRIRTRASILFTKVLFRVLLLITSIVGALSIDSSFIVIHFWKLDSCSTYFVPLQYASALIVSYYCWECAMLASYASVKAAVYVHHWFSIIAAANILFGFYSPMATNYGMFIIAFNPVTDAGAAIRFQYASKYPEFTCNFLKFGTYYFATMLVCSWIGSIIIISRCFVLGFDNHNVPIWSVVMYIGAMVGWGYDDVHLIKTFWGWSQENYKDAVFDMDLIKRLASGRLSNVAHIAKHLE